MVRLAWPCFYYCCLDQFTGLQASRNFSWAGSARCRQGRKRKGSLFPGLSLAVVRRQAFFMQGRDHPVRRRDWRRLIGGRSSQAPNYGGLPPDRPLSQTNSGQLHHCCVCPTWLAGWRRPKGAGDGPRHLLLLAGCSAWASCQPVSVPRSRAARTGHGTKTNTHATVHQGLRVIEFDCIATSGNLPKPRPCTYARWLLQSRRDPADHTSHTAIRTLGTAPRQAPTGILIQSDRGGVASRGRAPFVYQHRAKTRFQINSRRAPASVSLPAMSES